MTRRSLVSASLILATAGLGPASGLAATIQDQALARAVQVVGCPKPASDFGGALQAWPGGANPGTQIVASLHDEPDEDILGRLCVGLVSGADFKRAATLSGPEPAPPSEVSPVTNVDVSIDKTPFPFRPGETAFAVRVTGEFNSTSTNASWTMLYLFRRDGGKLIEIFHGQVADTDTDKTSGQEGGREKIVKFSTTQHQGAFDLMLAPKRGKGKTFVWNGARYIAG